MFVCVYMYVYITVYMTVCVGELATEWQTVPILSSASTISVLRL